MKLKCFFSITFILFPVLIHAEIKTEVVQYKHAGATLKSFMTYDDSIKEKRPGILIAPEWWGLNDYPKNRAKQLTELGYVVLAIDIYGEGKITQDPKEAGQLSGFYKNDRSLLRGRVLAGLNALKNSKKVNSSQVAAIGYCFGGTSVLELARSGADVKGVVSFHGGLDTPQLADAKNIKAKVLVLHGADDNFVPQDQILAFQKEMKDAQVNWQMNYYSNAVHTFTNPNADEYKIPGVAYNKQADERSWKAMLQFFDEIFK
ncbi:MAG: dienelactone hydrolase family protein [Elusimicrobiota bacterium]